MVGALEVGIAFAFREDAFLAALVGDGRKVEEGTVDRLVAELEAFEDLFLLVETEADVADPGRQLGILLPAEDRSGQVVA